MGKAVRGWLPETIDAWHGWPAGHRLEPDRAHENLWRAGALLSDR